MDLSRAAQIPGWMWDQELEWLAKSAQDHKLIVEIGSFLGRSTRALGENTPGKVYAVDDFNGTGIEFKPDGRPFTQQDRESIFSYFNINLGDLIADEKVIPVKISYDTIEMSGALGLLQPDMVFIDGDHSYPAVCRDIRYWKPRLAPGGLLCGHDFCYEPVANAVKEILVDNGISVTSAPSTSIWFCHC